MVKIASKQLPPSYQLVSIITFISIRINILITAYIPQILPALKFKNTKIQQNPNLPHWLLLLSDIN